MGTAVTLGFLALLQLEHVSSATITSFKQKKRTSPVSYQPQKLPHSRLRAFTQVHTAVADIN